MRARRASPPPSFPSRLVPESADRVGDDAAVVLVPQAPPYELFGHGRGQISHLAPELLSGTADIRVHLSLRGFDEALRFGAGGFDEAPLLLPRFLERLLANGGPPRGGLTQPRRPLLHLTRRLR